MNSDAQHAQWRTELWLRLAALEPAVVGRVASRTSVSRSDLEELWSDLLSTAVQAPGTPGAMDADAMALGDPELRKWLTRALFNDAIDLHRQRTRRDDGTAWIDATPLEDLERTLQRHTTNTPELDVVAAETARSHLQSIHDVAGPNAAKFVVAEAAGVRTAVDRGLLGMTRAKVEDARVRLEMRTDELRMRMRSVIIWLLPDTLMRWLGPLFATGNVPRLGAVGIAVVALAGGGTAAVHHEQAASSKSHHRSTARTAASKASASTLRPVHLQIPTAAAAATVRHTAQRQHAAKVAAATAARKTRKRRAAAKAAAAARKASTQRASAATQLTQQNFGTKPASSGSSSTSTRSASTASNSDALAREFEPGGTP